jgi:hypothetical protein
MAYQVKIHYLAHEEYINSFEWYEIELEGLGYKSMNAVEKRIGDIKEHPGYYSHLRGSYGR